MGEIKNENRLRMDEHRDQDLALQFDALTRAGKGEGTHEKVAATRAPAAWAGVISKILNKILKGSAAQA